MYSIIIKLSENCIFKSCSTSVTTYRLIFYYLTSVAVSPSLNRTVVLVCHFGDPPCDNWSSSNKGYSIAHTAQYPHRDRGQRSLKRFKVCVL